MNDRRQRNFFRTKSFACKILAPGVGVLATKIPHRKRWGTKKELVDKDEKQGLESAAAAAEDKQDDPDTAASVVIVASVVSEESTTSFVVAVAE